MIYAKRIRSPVRNMFRARREGYCPSCGRYIGAADVCPYCGARVRTRISLKAITIFALLISTIGIGYLYYAAYQAKPPTIMIEDIKPEMNYARVKIVGYVVTSTVYNEATRSLYFRLKDVNGTWNAQFATDTIMVYAYAPTSEELIELEKLPISGDLVEVVGTLRVRDTISLIINYPEDLIIKRSEPEEVSIAEILANWTNYLGKAVKVTGWLVEYNDYGDFATGDVKDYAYPNATLSLYIPEPSKRLIGELPEMEIGAKYEFIANVWEYREAPEIIPWNGSSVKLVEPLRFYPLAEILDHQDEYINQERIVKVNVTVMDWVSALPNKLMVNDGTVDVNVTVWIDFDVWDALDSATKTKLNTRGTIVILIAKCTEYKGEFELGVYSTDWIVEVKG